MSDREREIISDFSDYVQEHLRDENNRNISVSTTDNESHKYVMLRLLGFTKADDKFFNTIKDFRPGTKCSLFEDSETDKYICSVMIPFNDPRDNFKSNNKHNDKYIHAPAMKQPPSTINFLFAVSMLMAWICVGVVTTDKSEWWGLF